MRKHRPNHAGLLQEAANALSAGLPDRLSASMTNTGWINFSLVGWSPALTRRTFSIGFNGSASWTLGHPVHGQRSLEDAAQAIVNGHFGREIADQHVRHESARALGLVGPDGGCCDLEPDRMTIDRSLLRMLDAAGVDIRAKADAIGRSDGSDIELFFLDQIVLEYEERETYVLHNGVGPPTIYTWEQIGSARYNGSELELRAAIPDTIATAATGRPLGDLLETGWPEIDGRAIRSVDLDYGRNLPAQDERDAPLIRIVIEEDLVTLRDAEIHRG